MAMDGGGPESENETDEEEAIDYVSVLNGTKLGRELRGVSDTPLRFFNSYSSALHL